MELGPAAFPPVQAGPPDALPHDPALTCPFESDSRDAGLVLHLALEMTGLGVFERGLPDGPLVWRNERTYDVYGWPRDEPLHVLFDQRRFFDEVVHPDDRQAVREALAPLLARGGTTRLRHRIVRRVDGAVAWLDVQLQALVDSAGQPVRLVGVAADVTQQQLTRLRLEERERQFRLLFEALPVGMVIGRRNGGMYLFNDAAARMLGCGREAFARMKPSDYVISHTVDELVALRARCFEQGSFDEPMRFRTCDGRELDVLNIARYIELQGWPMIFWIWIDLTERTQAERALQEADRAKDRFLAMLAHELRNPMAPLRNAVRLLERDDLDPAQRPALLAMMRRQCMQLGRLVDDLLEVSRITQNKICLRRETVSIEPAVRDAIETVQPLIEARHQRLDVSLRAGSPIPVDPLRVAQIVTNLLTNASKFTPEHGLIALDVNDEPDAVTIRVRDTGAGIGADMLPRVFDLFWQADQSLDRSQGGLGVGLALVRRLVELHGGSVQADSTGEGQGTCMTVRLPREPGEPHEPGGGH